MYAYMYIFCLLVSIYLSLIIFLGEHEVISAPKPGLASDLIRTYLQQSKASVACNTLSHHRNCIQMEKAVNFALA